MGQLVDRAKARIGRIKADRSTEMGMAGHQAAMTALGKAAGWESDTLPFSKGDTRVAVGDKSMFTPGAGHVSAYTVNWKGTKVPKDYYLTEGTKGISKNLNRIFVEPNVIDRHKPTEDF